MVPEKDSELSHPADQLDPVGARAADGVPLVSLAPRARKDAATRDNASDLEPGLEPGRARQRIARRKSSGPVPLSFVQERLWFFDQLAPGCPAYNSFRALRLTGSLDIATLQRTIDALLERHEALRTTFPLVDGAPTQVVNPATSAALRIDDLSMFSEDEQALAVRARIVAAARAPFDLAHDSLFRTVLLRLGEQEHVLLLVLHHIIFDGWSAQVLITEFSAIYTAFLAEEGMPLDELPIQYADFAVWQREQMHGTRLETQLAYWQRQFTDGLPVLQLPTDHPRPTVQTFAGARAAVRLPASLLGDLKAMSRHEGATLFMTLLTGYYALLARYSGQDRIVVGSPIAGRTRVETEGLIGCFINTLAFNVDLSGDPSFRELLRRVRRTALDGFSHQELPFERLVEALAPARDLSRTPVFQTMFQLRNMANRARTTPEIPESGALRIEELEVDPGVAKFDLTLEAVERADGIDCSCEYATDLFERATIERLLDHYGVLLECAIADPDLPLSRLPMLSSPERQRLVIEWNATARDFAGERCVHQLFEERAALRPEAVAIRDQGREITYAELNADANRLAHLLRTRGVGSDSTVGVYLERSHEFIIAVLAILKAGGAYVPLDPSHPPSRLALMLDDSNAVVVLTRRSLREQLASWFDSSGAQTICLDAEQTQLMTLPSANLPCTTTGDGLAYVIYTSGSTGEPKGVAVTHRNILRLVMNTDYVQLSAGDVMAHVSNCSFDAATFEIWGALLAGACLVVIPRDVALSPEALRALLRGERISVIFLTTALFNQVVAATPDAFHSVSHVLFGGEAVDPRSVRLALEYGPPQRLLHVYGPTETTTFATWHLVTDVAPGATTIPIGRPIANTTAYVLDSHQQLVPIGVPGELYIGGDGVAQGYLNQPELTAKRFVDDPFSIKPHTRLYRTGDQVRQLPDGSIEFLGRLDEQVKIRGFRIEPGEIEAALSQHAGVAQATVLVREGHVGGISGKKLVAYVVPKQDMSVSPQSLRQDLIQRLPDYMIPSALMVLDTLPVTPNGKVDRSALPVPDWTESRTEAYAAPRTATEEALTRLWTSLLETTPISIYDDFFALGGHSLLASRVVVGIAESLGITLPVRAVFEAPTIALLAEHIEHARRLPEGANNTQIAPVAPVVRATRTEEAPLSFAQERFWFLDQLTPGTATYNVPLLMRITGQLDVVALEHTFSEIVRRHEALRTTFVVVDGVPVQRIASPESLTLPVIDLAAIPQATRMDAAHAFAQREFERPFDLAVGPLFRAQLLHLAGDDHVLVLTIHHSVFDGWSISVLYRELAALYVTFATGQPSPLPDLPLQYVDYAIWQRTQLHGDALTQHRNYWHHQLADAPLLLQIPTDRPRPAARRFHGERHRFDVPIAVVEQLRQLSRAEGATLYMTLLSAFQILLGRYTSQDDLLVGSPIARRPHIELEHLIGCFLNILVLRGDLHGDPSFRELLGRTREVALGAYANQDLPFEQLLEILEPVREASYSPVVQVLFILQNSPQHALALPGLNLRPLEVENGTTKYDLTLEIFETDDGLVGSLHYDSDLFDAATIARMASHFQTLIAGIAADPDQHISQLPLLTPSEREQVLDEWNATTSDYPADTSIIALFEAQVERTPDAVAFTCAGEALTYRELNTQANQLARYLRQLGVGPEVMVGVCFERSFELIIALLSIFKAGGAYVPLDPDYPLDRLDYMLADSGAPVLLGTKHVLERFSSTPTHVVHLVPIDGDTERVAIAAQALENLDDPATAAEPGALAYVLYTSGSTGKPKGVALEHRQLLNRFAWMWKAYPFASEDVGCQKTSINFVDSLWEIFGPLVHGVRSVVIPDRVLKDPALLLDELAAERVTRLWVVPSFLRTLLEAYPNLAQRLPDITFWAIGGEALSPELKDRFDACMPDRTLVNIYGASEFFDATFFDCHATPAGMNTIPIGRPLANMQAYILDAHLQPTPIGVPGDLYIGGVGLARGYLNQPEITAERFIAAPFSDKPQARIYRTGDRARWRSDGQLEYLGRTDHQVKLRGIRVELGEIEGVLAQHPAVRQSIATLREVSPGMQQLVAYVVLHEDAMLTPTARELRSFAENRLPAHMTPVMVVILPAFPLTPSGKLDRLALPAPDRNNTTEGLDEKSLPTNAVELELMAIWVEVLGVSPISAHANFFDLGGHSLLAVRMFARLETAFGIRLPLAVLFSAPTVEQLARVIVHEHPTHARRALVTIQPGDADARSPLFLIHPLGAGILGYAQLAYHLGTEQTIYGLQADLDEPSSDIVEMATQYVAEIRTAQPSGPYHLVGYSAGGLIAFEMAQQLTRMGETVALLAMLDSLTGNPNQRLRDRLSVRFAWRFLRDMPGYLSAYITQRTMQQRLDSFRMVARVLGRKLARRASRTQGSVPESMRLMLFDAWTDQHVADLPTHIGKVVRAHSLAVRNYRLQHYPGHVTVFRAASQMFFTSHYRDQGWGMFAESVSVYKVPGSHKTMIAEPHVRVLAERLGTCLREAQTASSINAETRDLVHRRIVTP
jgi:amino acid adenylation domain-containing protein